MTTAARFRPADPTTAAGATRFALRELARRVQNLEAECTRLDDLLESPVSATAPKLVASYGVGTDTAGALLVSAGDNPERLRSEAAFAHLCGVAPIDASSGLTTRKRLNRGGDRSANHALWRIVGAHGSRCTYPCLRRAAHRGGSLQARDHPLAQTLHRPRALPLPPSSTASLTSIGASEPITYHGAQGAIGGKSCPPERRSVTCLTRPLPLTLPNSDSTLTRYERSTVSSATSVFVTRVVVSTSMSPTPVTTPTTSTTHGRPPSHASRSSTRSKSPLSGAASGDS